MAHGNYLGHFINSSRGLIWKGTLQSSLFEIACPQETTNLDVARSDHFPMWHPMLISSTIWRGIPEWPCYGISSLGTPIPQEPILFSPPRLMEVAMLNKWLVVPIPFWDMRRETPYGFFFTPTTPLHKPLHQLSEPPCKSHRNVA